jgi:hypothetical protein
MFRLLFDLVAGLGILAITVLALFVVAVVGGVRAVARSSRNLRGRIGPQGRPPASRCGRRLLDVRALADPNPSARRIATLRQRLADEIDATDRMLTHTGDGRVFTADARALLAELRESAASVDADLRAVAAYRDATLQDRALTLLTEQAEHLIAVSYRARQTALETSVHDRWRHIASLTSEVDHQAGAFARYRNEASELDLDTGPVTPFGGAAV